MIAAKYPGRLRERVKAGEMTPKEALELLEERRKAGHHVNPRIVGWLKRRSA